MGLNSTVHYFDVKPLGHNRNVSPRVDDASRLA
jgi:hypothetical protein